MSEPISCYDAYELFLHTLNSKPVTEREKALCRAFFQSAWEAKEIELSASQARDAKLREKLADREAAFEARTIDFNSAYNANIAYAEQVRELKQRAEAAEARISEWQQGENEDLTAVKRENAELRKLLESKVPEGREAVLLEVETAIADELGPEGYKAFQVIQKLKAQPKEPKQ